jgi:hypothetical protein
MIVASDSNAAVGRRNPPSLNANLQNHPWKIHSETERTAR